MDQIIRVNSEISIPLYYRIEKAVVESYRGAPVRKLGGYLTTSAGDRQGQKMMAALEKGAIDFGPYREHGKWNDNHYHRDGNGTKFQITVGYPIALEFNKGVGWWTEGFLIPDDESDEKGLSVSRANYYWDIAKALDRMSGYLKRSLGLSLEGFAIKLSRDKTKILKAVCLNAAVCEVPINPECQLNILKSFYDVNILDSVENDPDGVEKALSTSESAPFIREDFGSSKVTPKDTKAKIEELMQILQKEYPHLSRNQIKAKLKKMLITAKKLKGAA